jgi:hypothetical protein
MPSGRRLIRALALRAAGVYKACSLVLLNCLVLYLLLNLFLGASFWIYDACNAGSDSKWGIDPITASYPARSLDRVYAGWGRRERLTMLRENWNRPFTYDDYTHFRERPIAGKYVHVSDAGYRHSRDQGPWPPVTENLNIFVFGGSTTFGYGLPDDQTIPSCLQGALAGRSRRRVCVYNFGVGWYYSTQERIALEKLLLSGHVPDIALFIDGLNDCWRPNNRPAFWGEMARVFEQVQGIGIQSPSPGEARDPSGRLALEVGFSRLPVGRASRAIVERIQSWLPQPAPPQQDGHTRVELDCNVYLTNKFLIEQLCRRYEVTPLFVWQPVPGYKYDLKHHLFAYSYSPEYRAAQEEYYRMMRRSIAENPPGPHFLWCADIQQDRAEPLYVDGHHYTAAFSKVFAESIVRGCLERDLLDKHLGLKSPADMANRPGRRRG